MEVDQQQHAWIKLRADGYEAVVSVAKVMEYPSSYLATLVQLELAQGSPDPAVRLDCDAQEAKEIAAVLRQVRRVPHSMPLGYATASLVLLLLLLLVLEQA
jgi:hypothetical protein